MLLDCFFKLSHFHFALLDYQQADELSPNDNNVSLRLSVVYNEFALLDYKEHKYSSAEDYFSQAIDSNPTVPLYYLSRARSRYMQKVLSLLLFRLVFLRILEYCLEIFVNQL